MELSSATILTTLLSKAHLCQKSVNRAESPMGNMRGMKRRTTTNLNLDQKPTDTREAAGEKNAEVENISGGGPAAWGEGTDVAGGG